MNNTASLNYYSKPLPPIGRSNMNEYPCYPLSFLEIQDLRDKSHIEATDKIVLPPSTLDKLMKDNNIESPFIFMLQSSKTGQIMYAGVEEFIANEGTMYAPSWMMDNLYISPGDKLMITSVSLPKGSYTKLRPQTSDFLSVPDHQTLLEENLKNYITLTSGKTISIKHFDKDYAIDVLETEPAPAICILDTDLTVEFEKPADYVEPEPIPEPTPEPIFKSTSEPTSEIKEESSEEEDYWSKIGKGYKLGCG